MSAKIKAGEAYVKLSTSGSLKRGLDRAARSLTSFGARVAKISAGIGVAMAGGGAAMVASFARGAADLQKLATQTGATVEGLSRMRYAAEKLRIDPDDLSGAVEELNIRLGETIRDGTGPAAEAFKQLGLDANRLAKIPLQARLSEISEALRNLPASKRGFLADEIFGGDAFKILPLIDKGAKGIAELADESDRLGATVTTSQAEALTSLLDAWTQVKAVVIGVAREISVGLADAVMVVVDMAKPRLEELRELFQTAGPELMEQGILNLAKVFDYVVDAMVKVRQEFQAVRVAILQVVQGATLGIAGLIDAISKMQSRMAVAVLANPFMQPATKQLMLAALSSSEGAAKSVNEFAASIGTSVDTAQAELARLYGIGPSTAGADFASAYMDRKDGREEVDAAADKESRRTDPVPSFLERFLGPAATKFLDEAGKAITTEAVGFATALKDELKIVEGQTGNLGTFSAAAASQLGRSGDTATKQLEQLKQANELTKAVLRLISRRGPLVWGP